MGKKLYKRKHSAIHNHGLFANSYIEKGTRVIEYLGEKISKEESSKRALEWEESAQKSGEGLVYIFELDDGILMEEAKKSCTLYKSFL